MTVSAVGEVLRRWRGHRGMSQLDLALAADVSQRHLSFVETGRAQPSADLLLHLSRHLALSLRAQNDLLLAAGYAPRYSAHRLEDDAMAPIHSAILELLSHHDPYPAVVVDRAYDLVAANRAATSLLALVTGGDAPAGVNLMALTLDPEALGGACLNLVDVASAMVERLERDRLVHPEDERLEELWAMAASLAADQAPAETPPAVAVPIRLATPSGELALFSVLATVGSAVDITAEELSVELFYPMDDASADRLRELTTD